MKNVHRLCGLAATLAILLSSCTKPPENAGFDWPRWRGPDGNGQSRETEWDPSSIANPHVLWKADVGMGYSNVVIQRGRLYAMGMDPKIWKEEATVLCLDAATGRKIWKRAVPSKAARPQTTPVVDGDSLFVLTPNGYLHRIDARSGRKRWQKDLVADYGAVRPMYDFAGSPVLAGDLVLVTANTAGMAVRRDDGALAWTSERPPREIKGPWMSRGIAYSTPVIFEDGGRRRALIVSWRGITAMDVQTGVPAWRFDHAVDDPYATPDPLAIGDRICVAQSMDSDFNPEGYLLQARGDVPRLLWKTPEVYCSGPGLAAVGGYLYHSYFGMYGPHVRPPASLRCNDLETGRLMWEESLGEDRESKSFLLTAAGDVLIVLDELGTLYTAKASPEGFEEIARCDVLEGANKPRQFFTPPVLCNAKIYCRNYVGDLVCIDVSK